MKKIISLAALLIVLVMSATMLVACFGVDFDKAEEILEDEGYLVVISGEEDSDYDYEGASRTLVAVKISLLESSGMVVVIEFTDKDSMNSALEDIESDELSSGWVLKTSGTCVIFGDEDSVDLIA